MNPMKDSLVLDACCPIPYLVTANDPVDVPTDVPVTPFNADTAVDPLYTVEPM
jgi:hypothetical protein